MRLTSLRRHWERLGRQDPFWAVLTDPDKRHGAWDLEQFYRSGIDELAAVLHHAEQLGLTPSRERALDFGCGAGRMTQAMAASFERADGVDISASMLETARRHNRFAERCVYHLNPAPNLELFANDTFSFVFTTLVLQHMEPRFAVAYIREFVRVLRPGGLLVFQVPSHRTASEPQSASTTEAIAPLPDDACRAGLTLADQSPPSLVLRANAEHTLRVRVENRSPHLWPGVPAAKSRYQINLANHWLTEDGDVLRRDDGRCPLPHDVPPGSSVDLLLGVHAPPFNGPHWIELDLVQENVGWFAERGSPTIRIRCDVNGGVDNPAPRRLPPVVATDEPLFRQRHPRVYRVLYATGLRDLYWSGRRTADRVKARRDRAIRRHVHPLINWWLGRPFDARMEMHCVPRAEVVRVLENSGARVLDTQEELVTGGFQSYRYWVTKYREPGAGSRYVLTSAAMKRLPLLFGLLASLSCSSNTPATAPAQSSAARGESTPSSGATSPGPGYLDNTGRADVLAGGVRMIPIHTPKGDFRVWTKRVGNNPRIKVLLLHGGPGATHEYFEAADSFFPGASIEYYYYDQLGSAYSDQPKDTSLWDLPRFVDEVEQVRAALGLDKDNFYLLGHSWGGILAIEYALAHQDHLKGLIISDMMASIPAYNEYAHKVLMPAMDQKALQEIQQLEAKKQFESPRYMELLMPNFYVFHILRMPPEQWPDPVLRAFNKLNHEVYVLMQGPSEMGASGTLEKWDRTADLPKIAVPTLTIGAQYDTMDPKHMAMMAKSVKKGRYLYCPNGSHLALYDDQQTYFNGVVSFLRDVDSARF